MKSNRIYIIVGFIFLCLCLALAIGIIGFNFLQNRHPSSLSNGGYYVRGSTIYYHPGFGIGEPFEILEADRDSFVILDGRYALDSSRVFYGGVPIPDADPSTFELLASPFSRDARHVYAGGDIFSNDPANFERLSENVSRDSQHIYWSGNIISDDPLNLVLIWDQNYYTYLKDSTTVFANGNPIRGVDIATFEVIIDSYARDEAHIFYFGNVIPEADNVTFEVLESPYASDAESVFWMENIIPDADPNTFRILNANFECSADSESAYYQDQLIPNFDPTTIPTTSQVTNCDINGMYFSP